MSRIKKLDKPVIFMNGDQVEESELNSISKCICDETDIAVVYEIINGFPAKCIDAVIHGKGENVDIGSITGVCENAIYHNTEEDQSGTCNCAEDPSSVGHDPITSEIKTHDEFLRAYTEIFENRIIALENTINMAKLCLKYGKIIDAEKVCTDTLEILEDTK